MLQYPGNLESDGAYNVVSTTSPSTTPTANDAMLLHLTPQKWTAQHSNELGTNTLGQIQQLLQQWLTLELLKGRN